MLHRLKQAIKNTPLYYPLFHVQQFFAALRWNGTSSPPPGIKQRILRGYGTHYRLRVFVETGTYRGNTVAALKDDFDKIYSVELDNVLYERAKRRFQSVKHIEIRHGDSGTELPHILNTLTQPALFWLDAHASGGDTAKGETYTSILDELRHILPSEHKHVILIDDADSFGTYDYPTLSELEQFVFSHRKNARMEIRDTIIRIVLA